MSNNQSNEQYEQHIGELTADIQRIQADFINYRRRAEEERAGVLDSAKAATIMKLLPVVDDIERAVAHVPAELEGNAWAKGVSSLAANLSRSLQDMGVTAITAAPGTPFNPNQHEAVMLEEGDGDHQVVSEELRKGYMIGSNVIRPAMVKVRPVQMEQAEHLEPVITDELEGASDEPHLQDKQQD